MKVSARARDTNIIDLEKDDDRRRGRKKMRERERDYFFFHARRRKRSDEREKQSIAYLGEFNHRFSFSCFGHLLYACYV